MKKTDKSWRRAYIRLINDGPLKESDFSSREEKQLEMDLMIELIRDGYALGPFSREVATDGEILRAVEWRGPTAKGRVFADELAERERQDSFRYRVKEFGIATGGWVAGILSGLLLWWLTK
jgi:hypothetical protein